MDNILKIILVLLQIALALINLVYLIKSNNPKKDNNHTVNVVVVIIKL